MVADATDFTAMSFMIGTPLTTVISVVLRDLRDATGACVVIARGEGARPHRLCDPVPVPVLLAALHAAATHGAFPRAAK
jgi:hypothetical protein